MPDTAVTLQFGDGVYRFWLPMARIVEIERIAGRSVVQIYDDLGQALGLDAEGSPRFLGGGNVRIAEIYEVIRCGAIGGDSREANGQTGHVSALDAKRLADGYVDGRPIAETAPVAWAILNAAILGVELPKKKAPAAAPKSRSRSVRG